LLSSIKYPDITNGDFLSDCELWTFLNNIWRTLLKMRYWIYVCALLSYDFVVIMHINKVRTFLQNIYTWYHNPEDHSMNIQCQVILVKSTKVTTWLPQNWNDFLWNYSLSGDKYSCHISLLYGHYNFESRHTELQESSFLGPSSAAESNIAYAVTEIYYAHFKANEIPVPVT
jgi:hypothetical protein